MTIALLWWALHRWLGALFGPHQWTRIRMGDGISFRAEIPYRDFQKVWVRALGGYDLIMLERPNGRLIALNLRQIVYIEQMP